MYWLRKRLLSQNFLTNRQLIKKLIRGSSIGKNDLVLEIGAGSGVITNELLQVAGQVVAIELDPKLYAKLRSRFVTNPRLQLVQSDFLGCPLPRKPYKVFSNIPFSITADVIRKLLVPLNPPLDCYLVMQSQAAEKFTINSTANSMAAVLYYPWWKFEVVHKFSPLDFYPRPSVDSVLLHICPRPTPLVSENPSLYRDFVVHSFTTDKKAKFLPVNQWLYQFNHLSPKKIKLVQSSFAKYLKSQQLLSKIHRTRTDSNWRQFKKSSLTFQ